MPLGFNQRSLNGKNMVLLLKNILHDLHESPPTLYEFFTEKLNNSGQPQVPFDPCHFTGKKVIVICCLCFLELLHIKSMG